MSPIVWLASYPKSGNTWLRAVLTGYLDPDDAPVSINRLVGGGVRSRRLFDDVMGLASADLTPAELLRYRSRFHELVAAEFEPPSFCKVHGACLRTDTGTALFPRSASMGAVYLIRNPLDVAISYAHHSNCAVTATVAWMSASEATEGGFRKGIHPTLPEPLLTWSGHASSWLDDAEMPVHVARYEDLLADPEAGFGEIVRFAGLERDAARLARAVEHARFDRLRAEEARCGFDERQPTAASFFRAGVAGSWRTTLTRTQVRAVVDAHRAVMARFGYLEEAEAFLAAGDGRDDDHRCAGGVARATRAVRAP